ncbi:MAG: hypothetical protein OWU33_15435 [Firmicutes bacterium]|nr:hypothetical protein [Bacillota bacterium]
MPIQRGIQYDDRWSLRGIPAIVLANRWLRVVVLPQLGGKIWSIEYRPHSREWLWHNPRIDVGLAPFGAAFDDYWSGGADVAFPSCYESTWNGWKVPDLGELWSIPWNVSHTFLPDSVTLTLTVGGRIWPVEVQRTITLNSHLPVVNMTFKITNVGSQSFPFLLGFHPAIAAEPGYRLDLAPGNVKVDEGTQEMGDIGQEYSWPYLAKSESDRPRDMRIMPPYTEGSYGGHFFRPSTAALWWAITDPKEQSGIGLVASINEWQGLWIWQVFGGWRGYYHVAVEPWTGYPITLHEAVKLNSARWLAPHSNYQATLTTVCYEGIDHVTAIDIDGTVFS